MIMSGAPAVSVVIPAFEAEYLIPRAVRSIWQCGLPPDRVEVVIASDDGMDYGALLGQGPIPVACSLSPHGIGPGLARNRAIAQAKGDFIAFLDCDDTWEPDYLARALPMAHQYGVAFGTTSVLCDQREILRLPGGPHLNFEIMGKSGASFVPIVARGLAGPFSELLAEDILHSLELLALIDGRAQVSPAAYQIHVTADSISRQDDFSVRVARDYDRHVSDITAGRTRIPARFTEPAAAVFQAKQRLNGEYVTRGDGLSYYEFIARELTDRTNGQPKRTPRLNESRKPEGRRLGRQGGIG